MLGGLRSLAIAVLRLGVASDYRPLIGDVRGLTHDPSGRYAGAGPAGRKRRADRRGPKTPGAGPAGGGQKIEQRVPAVIAAELRVSERSTVAEAWQAGGPAGLASRGQAAAPWMQSRPGGAGSGAARPGRWRPGGRPAVDAGPRPGPVARKFRVQYTIPGIWDLLQRRLDLPAGRGGPSSVMTARWRCGRGRPGRGETTVAALGGWIVFEDECGESMSRPGPGPGQARITPVVRVRGGYRGASRGRAGLLPAGATGAGRSTGCTICGRKGETKAFTWTEYRDLPIAAHRQLPGGNVVLVWDNLNVHLSGRGITRRSGLAAGVPAARVCALPVPVEILVGTQGRRAGQPRRRQLRPPGPGHRGTA